MTPTYTPLADKFSVMSIHEELGIEGFTDIGDFIESKIGSIGKILKKITGEDVPGIKTKPLTSKKAVKVLSTLSKDELTNLKVYRPVDLDEFYVEYASLLNRQVAMLSQIITTIYQPIIDWTGGIIADNTKSDKAWVDRNIVMVDIKSMTKELSKLFSKKGTKTGDSSITTFEEIYADVKDVERTEGQLISLFDIASEIDLELMLAKEKEVDANVNKFIELYENDEIEVPKASLKRLLSLVSSAAEETEYLSGLLFLSEVAINTHNENIEMFLDK